MREQFVLLHRLRRYLTFVDNSLFSIDVTKQLKNSEHEKTIKSLEFQQASLTKELNHLRQLYDQTKSDSVKKTHQIELLKDFYTEQHEMSRCEHADYLIQLFNLFEKLSNSKNNDHFKRQNSSSTSLEEIRNNLDQRVDQFLTNYKSLLIKNSENQGKSMSNHLALVLSTFQDKFSQLFENNGNEQINLTIENIHTNNPLLNNVISFLSGLYEQINKILHDKTELSERLISLEKKHRQYLKLQMKIFKTIHEDKHTSLYLKQLANQMAEQIEELTNRQSSVSRRTSSVSTIGNNPVRIPLFHFFFTSIRNRVVVACT